MRPATPNSKQLSKILGEFRDNAKVGLTVQYLARHPRTRLSEIRRLCGVTNLGDLAAVCNRKLRKHGFMIAAHPSPIPYIGDDCRASREHEWSIHALSPTEKTDPEIKPTVKDPLWKKRRAWLLDQAESLACEINGLIAKTRMGLPAE